jgi:hypothetical protein
MYGSVLFVWVRVVVLFIALGIINVCQKWIIICFVRFVDCTGFIFYLFIVLCDIVHAVFLQLLVNKKPPCDGVEAQ